MTKNPKKHNNDNKNKQASKQSKTNQEITKNNFVNLVLSFVFYMNVQR